MKNKMQIRILGICAVMATAGFTAREGHAQAGVIRAGGREVLEILGKRGAKEVAEAGGEFAVREISERALREGGEQAARSLGRLTGEHGALAVKALTHAEDLGKLLKVVDNLPATEVAPSLRCLAGQEGKAMARLATEWGPKALAAEARNPGLASRLIKVFGQEGVEATGKLTKTEMLAISRCADDIAAMTPAAKETVGQMLARNAKEFAKFCGEFVKANPGKTLTAVAVVAMQERILGGTTIETGPDGKPKAVSTPGVAERMLGRGFAAVWEALKPWVQGVVGVASAIFLWHFWAVRSLKRRMLGQRLAR